MSKHSSAAGFSLIEVMITIFICAVGIMGLAGLQARALTAEFESVSRGQALLLVQDMVDRLTANPSNAVAYGNSLTTYGTGYGNACINSNAGDLEAQAGCCAGLSGVSAVDICEWDLALKGIVTANAGASSALGSLPGVRGCVRSIAADVYQVEVVWAGRDGTAGAVPAGNLCGAAVLGARRRGISHEVRIPNLSAL